MKYFFDTSVLVPAFLEDHVHHPASYAALSKASKKHSCCAAHTLAEVYSTLTRMPGDQRASGEEAMLYLENLSERLTFIALVAEEYLTTVRESAEAGIVGGRIYDALLARCAMKANAGTIYTWNVDHFRQFVGGGASRVRTP